MSLQETPEEYKVIKFCGWDVDRPLHSISRKKIRTTRKKIRFYGRDLFGEDSTKPKKIVNVTEACKWASVIVIRNYDFSYDYE